MVRKGLWVVASLTLALVLVGFILFKTNRAPSVAALSLQQTGDVTRPYVVKLHAQWCPLCMATKGVWTELQAAYADRVNLVVFDLTTKEKVEASRVEAKRIGLEAFFDAHGEEPGSIFVLDGATKEIKGSFRGSRQVSEYKSAIDRALEVAKK